MKNDLSRYSKRPEILLIVATYNCVGSLVRCMDGYFSQTYPNKKIVIIDGGSTDGTIDIIRQYQDKVAYWVSEPDQGIYHAWNKALRCGVEYDWVQFMGGDDYYYAKDVLSEVARGVKYKCKEKNIVYGKTLLKYNSGKMRVIGAEFDRDILVSRGMLPTGQVSIFYNLLLFKKYGIFCEQFKIAGDLEHFMRMVGNEQTCFLADLVTTVHRVGGVSSNYQYAYSRFIERELALQRNGYLLKRDFSYYYVKMIRYLKTNAYNIKEYFLK